MNSGDEKAALKALLGSIVPEGSNDNPKLTPEQLKKLSAKLDEILGEEKGEGSVNQNEKGEILNEEGLPIIDINEPLPVESDLATAGPETFVLPEPPRVLPLWALPSTELERRRTEQDRILDLLEEEERLEAEREEEKEEEERQKALQKRRDVAGKEIAGLKAAREMQKKMGRALVRGVTEDEEKEAPDDQHVQSQEKGDGNERDPLKPTKTVSFVLPEGTTPDQGTNSGTSLDWGDVVPAKLKPSEQARTPLPNSYGPMKTTVIERFPNTVEAAAKDPGKDSDDESNPPSPSVSSEEGHLESQFDDLAQGADEISEDEELEVESEEFDLDTAQHQRQIALEYYEKRNKIGAQASAAFSSDIYNPNEDPWDQPEVPLEASVTGERPKPAISRFKADRIVESASTSLEGSLLPASQSQLVQRAIKTGKIEEGNLVGDENNSDDEEMRAIMELLSKGDVENVGPTPSKPDTAPLYTHPESVPPKPRNRTSRFKLARNVGSDLPPPTPPSQDARSSPKLPIENTSAELPPTSNPSVISGVAERSTNPTISPDNTSSTAEPSDHSQRFPVNAIVAERVPSSAHSPRGIPAVVSRVQERGPKTPHPVVQQPIESPSFTSGASGERNGNSFIVNSPSFAPVSGNALVIDSPSFQPPPGRNRRGVAISDDVTDPVGLRAFDSKAKKVSRFAADRM